jgi:hypothetical protein
VVWAAWVAWACNASHLSTLLNEKGRCEAALFFQILGSDNLLIDSYIAAPLSAFIHHPLESAP